jgi:aspartate aminotransferase
MFAPLKQQPEDKILALMAQFRADPRDQKMDLGVGVYKDSNGITPVMRAIKSAEQKLWETENTKAYTGLLGDPAYGTALVDLILGADAPKDRLSAAATPGGTGAVRQAFELARMANPDLRVFVSSPTWPNHLSILNYLEIETVPYRYFDAETRGVDFAGMMADLDQIRPGDLVLLHGCCHNPTGANLTLPEWQTLADHLLAKGVTPMIDLAYQGFGDGLEQDAAATRLLAAQMPEMIIAASCSKNFGIYRERTGLLITLSENSTAQPIAQGTLAFLNRQNYSFPPDHGARLVTMILNDDTLRADWQAELEDMRLGMLDLRTQLANALKERANSDRFGFIAQHRGMFSRLGASPEQVVKLRDDYAIYMVGDSRINIAGLNTQTIPYLADAIIACGA